MTKFSGDPTSYIKTNGAWGSGDVSNNQRLEVIWKIECHTDTSCDETAAPVELTTSFHPAPPKLEMVGTCGDFDVSGIDEDTMKPEYNSVSDLAAGCYKVKNAGAGELTVGFLNKNFKYQEAKEEDNKTVVKCDALEVATMQICWNWAKMLKLDGSGDLMLPAGGGWTSEKLAIGVSSVVVVYMSVDCPGSGTTINPGCYQCNFYITDHSKYKVDPSNNAGIEYMAKMKVPEAVLKWGEDNLTG